LLFTYLEKGNLLAQLSNQDMCNCSSIRANIFIGGMVPAYVFVFPKYSSTFFPFVHCGNIQMVKGSKRKKKRQKEKKKRKGYMAILYFFASA
jgi:hypothetical protein